MARRPSPSSPTSPRCPHAGYVIGLPVAGRWREILNTDSAFYGGSNQGNLGGVTARANPSHGYACSAEIAVPPLATVWFVHEGRIRAGPGRVHGNRHGMGNEKVTYSTPLARSSMAYVLAGGRGSRLHEFTRARAKPAVYFGGKARIVDFALSNAINSGIRRIAVATQYKAHSLIRHLQRGWNFLQPMRNESFDILPASQRVVENMWYAGTADAVYQNIDIIDSYAPEYIVVLAGDHVYKMDYERMLIQHVNEGADVTIACIEVPVAGASGSGHHAHRRGRSRRAFLEKPAHPPEMPNRPGIALASMGIYVFRRDFLNDQLRRDAADPHSSHDFGKDLIPYIVEHGVAVAHHFVQSCVRSHSETESYWRDVGTLEAYFDANIDLTDVVPGPRRLRSRLADLDLRQDHAAGEIRPRHRRPARHGHFVAGLRRLHRVRIDAAQFAALRQRPRAFLWRHRPCDRAARRRHGPRRPAAQRHHRQQRAHPGRADRR